jgi:cyclase
MLKCRIIPIELLLGGRLVKTRLFNSPRDVGDPVKSSKVYSDQDADELLLLQIDREARNIKPLIDAVSRIAEHCFVPLTAGGGVSSLDDAAQLFEVGVDKVLVNSAAYSSLDVLYAISSHYGRQALVVGIDVRTENKEFVLYSDCGRKRERVLLGDHIASVIAAGAGELLLQAIDFDGMMQGYNLELLRRVVNACSVPVIIAAGAGQFSHLKDAFDSGAAAAACGSLFNFGDNNPLRAKAFLKNYGVPLKRVK